MNQFRGREARLKPEFAHLYPPLAAGHWDSAGMMADRMVAWLLAPERALRPEHFDFRGGGEQPRTGELTRGGERNTQGAQMVRVEWDFAGGQVDQAAAQKVVEKVLGYYEGALAGLTCPNHGQAPSLRVRGPSVETLAVSVETCCQVLSAMTDARIRAVSRRDQE